MINEGLAIDIGRAGVVDTKESMFKFNEEDSLAPKSLMKLNLRRVPEGKLTDKLIKDISNEFVRSIREKNIRFDVVVGLPRAGEPFAEKFVEIWNKKYPDKKRIIYLEKGKVEGKRRILGKIRGEFANGETALMIDDVISFGHSMIEAAKALRKNGLIVRHCAVLMDWGFGGADFLKKKLLIKTISEYLVDDFLHVWKKACIISRIKAEEILKRRDEIKAYGEKAIFSNINV